MKKMYVQPEMAIETVKNEAMLLGLSGDGEGQQKADSSKPVLGNERVIDDEDYEAIW